MRNLRDERSFVIESLLGLGQIDASHCDFESSKLGIKENEEIRIETELGN